MHNLTELLDRPIAFHRPLVPVTGSITAALMLSQALYWSKRTVNEDGWFYKTQDDWEEETGMSRYEQEGARKALKNRGLIEEKKHGIPCKVYYRVNLETLQTSLLRNHILDWGKPAGSDAENQQTNTETTQETTTETTKNISRTEKPRAGDQRHVDCKAIIASYWKAKNPDVEMPWDGMEGKALGMFLSASPDLTPEKFRALLRNRFKSVVNHSDRPGKWLRSLMSFNSGPLNEFGKPIGTEGMNGNRNHSAETKAERTANNVRELLSRRADYGCFGGDGDLQGSGGGEDLPGRDDPKIIEGEF